MEHADEPHQHTVTFTDNEGKAYTFEYECPATSHEQVARMIYGTGTEAVNDLQIDGDDLGFDGTFILLGSADLLRLLGQSYMTDENLMRVLLSIGLPDTTDTEPSKEDNA